jgi:hypothetical protein
MPLGSVWRLEGDFQVGIASEPNVSGGSDGLSAGCEHTVVDF